MIEYQKDNEFNIFLKESTNPKSLLESFKEKIISFNKLEKEYEISEAKVANETFILEVSTIYTLSLLTFYFSNVVLPLGVTLSLVTTAFIGCFLDNLREKFIDKPIFSKFRKWYQSLFKENQKIKHEYETLDTWLIELLEEPTLQKDLILDLKKLIDLLDSDYSQMQDNVIEDLSQLVNLLSKKDYLTTKIFITKKLIIWQDYLNTIETERTSKIQKKNFLKSMNMDLDINDKSQESSYNLKNML